MRGDLERARPPSFCLPRLADASDNVSRLSLLPLSLASLLFLSPPVEHVERVSSFSGGRHLCSKEKKRSEKATGATRKRVEEMGERKRSEQHEARSDKVLFSCFFLQRR